VLPNNDAPSMRKRQKFTPYHRVSADLNRIPIAVIEDLAALEETHSFKGDTIALSLSRAASHASILRGVR
jgi:hypothetical protein